MMPHEDEAQDADMIKTVLQKIIDDMDSLEANRIKPKADVKVMELSGGSAGIPDANENKGETPYEAEPENQDNQHEGLDPDVLKKLLDSTDQADETGSTSEDNFLDLPPAIADAVRHKKGLK